MKIMEFLTLETADGYYKKISKESLIRLSREMHVSLAVRLINFINLDYIKIGGGNSDNIKDFPFCGGVQFAYLNPDTPIALNGTVSILKFDSFNEHPVGHSLYGDKESIYHIIEYDAKPFLNFEYGDDRDIFSPMFSKSAPDLKVFLTCEAILSSDFMMAALDVNKEDQVSKDIEGEIIPVSSREKTAVKRIIKRLCNLKKIKVEFEEENLLGQLEGLLKDRYGSKINVLHAHEDLEEGLNVSYDTFLKYVNKINS